MNAILRPAKWIARKVGLFPLARRAYRMASPSIRRLKDADRAFYGNFISDGDLVFDIGANLGQKSEIFLACGARVVALEPNPLCLPTLRFELGQNERFELVEKAVGEKPSTATLNFVGTESTASLRAEWKWLNPSADAPVQTVDVPVTTLDALIAEFGVPDFCKIDVEGFELEVLRGLSRPLSLLSLEYHADELDKLVACLEHLQSLGPITVNVIAMNAGEFVNDDWLAPESFLRLAEDRQVPTVGDAFVRSSA